MSKEELIKIYLVEHHKEQKNSAKQGFYKPVNVEYIKAKTNLKTLLLTETFPDYAKVPSLYKTIQRDLKEVEDEILLLQKKQKQLLAAREKLKQDYEIKGAKLLQEIDRLYITGVTNNITGVTTNITGVTTNITSVTNRKEPTPADLEDVQKI